MLRRSRIVLPLSLRVLSVRWSAAIPFPDASLCTICQPRSQQRKKKRNPCSHDLGQGSNTSCLYPVCHPDGSFIKNHLLHSHTCSLCICFFLSSLSHGGAGGMARSVSRVVNQKTGERDAIARINPHFSCFLPPPSLLFFFVYACISNIFSFPAPYLTVLCSLYRPTSCFQNALFMHCCTLVCMDTMPILWTISIWTLFFLPDPRECHKKKKKKPRASIIWPHLLC